MADDPLIGFATDALRFDKLLGKGGMGAVYQGIQIRMERPVAIKVIAPHLASDKSYIERFSREAQTLGKLIHPNVITCHDFGPCKGPGGEDLFVMVLEFVDGWSLGHLSKHKRLTVRQVLELHRQACDGLTAAHHLSIVHRDIKPDNIMVTRQGQAKLADFGLAKGDDSALLTQTGAILGSPSYMAPEICRGEAPLPVSDLYSVGCSLFHLLTGHPPYASTSTLQVLHQHISAPVPKLADSRADLAMLEPIIQRCLDKSPEQRFPDAAALARELRQVITQVPSEAIAGAQTTGDSKAPRPTLAAAPTAPGATIGNTRLPASAVAGTVATATVTAAALPAPTPRSRKPIIVVCAAGAVVGLLIAALSRPGEGATTGAKTDLPAKPGATASGEPATAHPPAPDSDLKTQFANLDEALVNRRWREAEKIADQIVVPPGPEAATLNERLETARRRLSEHRKFHLEPSPPTADKPPTAVSDRPPVAAAKPGESAETVRNVLVQAEQAVKDGHGAQARQLLDQLVIPDNLGYLAAWRVTLLKQIDDGPAGPKPSITVLRPGEQIANKPLARGNPEIPGKVPYTDVLVARSAGGVGMHQNLHLTLPDGAAPAGGVLAVMRSGSEAPLTLRVEATVAGKAQRLADIALTGADWDLVRIPLADAGGTVSELVVQAPDDTPFFVAKALHGAGGMPAPGDLKMAPGTLLSLATSAKGGLRELITAVEKLQPTFLDPKAVRLVLPVRLSGGDTAAVGAKLRDYLTNVLVRRTAPDAPITTKAGEAPVFDDKSVAWYFNRLGMLKAFEPAPLAGRPQLLVFGLATDEEPKLDAAEWITMSGRLLERGTVPVLLLSQHGWQGKLRESWQKFSREVRAQRPGQLIIDLAEVPLYAERAGAVVKLDHQDFQQMVQISLVGGIFDAECRIEHLLRLGKTAGEARPLRPR